MGLVQDISAALVALHQGTALGTDIFAYAFDDLPHNALCIIPLAGQEPDRSWKEGGGHRAIDYPGVQVQIRNTSKATAESKAEAIRTGLDGYAVSNHLYCWTTRAFPIYLGKDDGTVRYRFSVDFRLAKNR
jgi:hypothetical protein